MSLEDANGVDRKFRGLKEGPAFQDSTFLEYSRSSPGALTMSGPAARLRTSDDEFFNSGAELDGEISPDALAMPAWLRPLL
jgi:hypothetical protein